MTESAAPATATPKDIKEALGYENTAAFAKDWKELTDKDKADLRSAVGPKKSGPMTY